MSGMHARAHNHHAEHSHDSPLGMGSVLSVAMVATIALVAAEFLGSFFGRSMALFGDALHNLSDVPALVISWLALRWAARPADAEKTFGYQRAGILAAFTNALLLLLVALGLFYEAWERFRNPVLVHTAVMVWVSIAALAVNGGITLALLRGRRDLNLRSVLVHNFGDAVSNIGILLGALLISRTGALWLDPAIAAAIGLLVLWSSAGILRESSHILLEGNPHGTRIADVAAAILAVPGVHELHDIHIWTLGTDLHALSCHVRIPDMHMDESERILAEIQRILEARFHITHTTIQFERAGLPRESGYVMPVTSEDSNERS